MNRLVRVSLGFGLACVATWPMFAQESSTSEVFERVEQNRSWTEQPTAFRGLSFGGSEADLVKLLGPVKCRDESYDGARYRECRATKNEARFMVNGRVVEDFYQFVEGKLVAVRFYPQTSMGSVLAAPAFADFLDAFREKFGIPTVTWKTRVKGVRSVHYNLLGMPLGPYVPYESVMSSAEWRSDTLSITVLGGGDGQFAWGLIQTAEWERQKKNAAKKPTSAF